jgi:hypothetical protein
LECVQILDFGFARADHRANRPMQLNDLEASHRTYSVAFGLLNPGV